MFFIGIHVIEQQQQFYIYKSKLEIYGETLYSVPPNKYFAELPSQELQVFQGMSISVLLI